MDLTQVEWCGGMSCARSSGRAGAGDLSSGLELGSSSSTCSPSTCSLKGELGKGSMIFGGWTEKSTRESGATTGGPRATTEGICASSGKRSKTEEEDKEARKWESSRQGGDVPKRQHCGRYEGDERQGQNTNTPFKFRHSQENNKVLTEAQVCYAYVAEEEWKKQNRRIKSGDSLEVTQKGTHMEFDFG